MVQDALVVAVNAARGEFGLETDPVPSELMALITLGHADPAKANAQTANAPPSVAGCETDDADKTKTETAKNETEHMKFTLSWLKDHLETSATLDDITDALTDLGLEVEGVEDPAEQLGAFTIARVIEAVQHPNADRLRLCRVETFPNGPDAASEEVQVVCGAPNARTCMVGVFAGSGTYIPGTDMTLKPGEIRGVASNGMLCSERELMISDDHEGIIDLPEDAPLGARFIDYAGLNDPVIEIAITPNRPDALGVAGVARDLAARGIGVLKTPAVEPVAGTYPSPINVTIDDDVQAKGCPVFYARLIKGVTNGPSPDWLQGRLRAIGLRPINGAGRRDQLSDL